MEAVVIVLRPKIQIAASEFKAKNFDVLLLDLPTTERKKSTKQLPKTSILFEKDASDTLILFINTITGGDRGKRAIFIPATKDEPVNNSDSFVKGMLYLVPVEQKEKLNSAFTENVPDTPAFYSLDTVLESLDGSSINYNRQTKIMLIRLLSWLREKHSVPGVMDVVFSQSASKRMKHSVLNPAVVLPSSRGDQIAHSLANETMAKMLALDKCEKTVINPLFSTSMAFKHMADKSVVNKYWGMGKPDYSKIEMPTLTEPITTWLEDYPMHKDAYEGNAHALREHIKRGRHVTERDRESWTPIHYAAYMGRIEAISVILNVGECSPNLATTLGLTPLHLAASYGHPYVVELLLSHRDVDVHALDKQNKTALDLCDGVPKPDYVAAAQLLKRHMNQPAKKIQVHIMDGTFRMVSLVNGSNTTVQQLHMQLLLELHIPEECAHIFTIWICSRNLQLQLKPDHKPIHHLNDWRRTIVEKLTDQDPVREDPKLFWRRDVTLSIGEEKQLTSRDSTAQNLLFHEAYFNYIKALYPCANQDAVILGGILMQLNQGDHDKRKANTFFNNERSLNALVPPSKIKVKNWNWVNKISQQWKAYSASLTSREPPVLQQHFLTLCWNLTVYGSAFFTGYVQKISTHAPTMVYIGVNDIGIHVIHGSTKGAQPILQIKLKNITKSGLTIQSKQAGLINYLMLKLSQNITQNILT